MPHICICYAIIFPQDRHPSLRSVWTSLDYCSNTNWPPVFDMGKTALALDMCSLASIVRAGGTPATNKVKHILYTNFVAVVV